MQEKKYKIGIMGGTFDPIHIGHLILGETAYEQFSLDKVLFMPSGNPPHKTQREGRATDEQRTEMVALAIERNPHFVLSLEEMNPDGYSYTYRTLERLNEENPDTQFYFIIGADSLCNFDKWMEPERICQVANIVVATRNHMDDSDLDDKIAYLTKEFDGTFLKLDSLNIDVSSGMLREWIRDQRTVKYYIPDEVNDYIEANNIYQYKT